MLFQLVLKRASVSCNAAFCSHYNVTNSFLNLLHLQTVGIVVHCVHELLQAVRGGPPELLKANTPEPVVKSGQSRTLCGPGSGCQPRDHSLAKLFSQPIPDHGGGVAGCTVLLEPQPLSGDLTSDFRPQYCLKNIQLDLLVQFNSRPKPVENNFLIHQGPPTHHFLSTHHPTLIFNLWIRLCPVPLILFIRS